MRNGLGCVSPNPTILRLGKQYCGVGGTHSAVYATEVSAEEYTVYTTEESEKLELHELTRELGGNLELAVRRLAERKREEQKQVSTPK